MDILSEYSCLRASIFEERGLFSDETSISKGTFIKKIFPLCFKLKIFSFFIYYYSKTTLKLSAKTMTILLNP